jgi:Hint domain
MPGMAQGWPVCGQPLKEHCKSAWPKPVQALWRSLQLTNTTIGTGTVSSGINLPAGSTVTNAGTINGGSQYGVYLEGTGGSIINTGTINSTGEGAIWSHGSLYLNNSGVITGRIQGVVLNGAATITNQASGTINGHYKGIYLFSTGSVSNAGSIGGSQVGVKLDGAGTVVDSGTITSSNAVGQGGPSGSYAAVVFGSTGSNRLVADPGAVFNGGVWAAAAGSNTLELASGNGSLTNFDTDFVNFQTIDVDAGANWALTGTETFGAFEASETIVAAPGATLTYNGEDVVCFCSGTRIRTPEGEVAVEELAVGDLVVTVDGTQKPIRWIGQRRLQVSPGNADKILPVRIERNAFADGMPHRDLLMSPNHAVFVDGMLICAQQLMNGKTIRRESGLRSVHYYHIALEEHAVLFAEGLPAESYLDTGNRGFFDNADAPRLLHPDLLDSGDTPDREAGSCAPFVTDAERVEPVWRSLATQAAALGRPVIEPVITSDHNLHAIAMGQKILPIVAKNGVYSFAVPAGTTGLRLVSRAGAPTDTRPWLGDRRRLGVPVTRLMLRTGTIVHALPLDHPEMSDGWWEIEREGVALRRWTNGDAVVPLPAATGRMLLEVHTGGHLSYVLPEEPAQERERKAA